MARIFIVDQREFPDPDPALTVEQVREMMATFFPELANATHTERQRGEDTIYEFQRRVGTKGVLARRFQKFQFSHYEFASYQVEAASRKEAIGKVEASQSAVYALPLGLAEDLAHCIEKGTPFRAPLEYR